MVITKEYIETIRPKIGDKCKYSYLIYRYLEKHKGEDVKTFESNGTIVIGKKNLDGIVGCNPQDVMRGPDAQEYWFDNNGWKLKEITGWLEKYQRVGRCLLIPHDFVWYEEEDTRFTYVNNTRKCNWCGQ